MPKTLNEAIAKYGRDTLRQIWYPALVYTGYDGESLPMRLKNKRKTEILFLAADLGHYIGDANMPLHTTINHNGQLTGQDRHTCISGKPSCRNYLVRIITYIPVRHTISKI